MVHFNNILRLKPGVYTCVLYVICQRLKSVSAVLMWLLPLSLATHYYGCSHFQENGLFLTKGVGRIIAVAADRIMETVTVDTCTIVTDPLTVDTTHLYTKLNSEFQQQILKHDV